MIIEPILKNKFQSILDLEELILSKFPDDINDRKKRGDIFEDFVYLYFYYCRDLYKLNKIYRNRSEELPKKYADLYKIYGDYGVDGLAIKTNDESIAWQVKFIKNRTPPSYEDITKLYFQGKNCDYNYIIANSKRLSRSNIYEQNIKHKQILYDKFLDLDYSDWNQIYKLANNITSVKTYKKPNKIQKEIVNEVSVGLQDYDKGKLIAACGTGKTLMSVWISERIKSKKILFLAPSLLLIRQTLKVWIKESKNDFDYLCVCSDSSIVKKLKQEDDEFDIDTSEIDIPLTDPKQIKNWFLNNHEKIVIFSTYHSLPALKEAISNTEVKFDLIIFDEAHRTAGAKESENFAIALNNENIFSNKRLFMTATERFVTKRTKKIAKERGYEIFSMDDVSLYGPTLANLTFGRAIKEGLISDYKILIAEITEDQIYEYIDRNEFLEIKNIESDKEKKSSLAKKIAHQILLCKAIEHFNVRKIVTFHSRIERAKNFIFSNIEIDNVSLESVYNVFKIKNYISNHKFSHLNASEYSTEERIAILDETFNHNEIGVVSNSRCLNEGIDVPIIDGIFFSDPKKSLTEIAQACGRALRLPFENKGDKTAYFIVPTIIPKNLDYEAAIDEENNARLYDIIQSLRDLDFRMEEWIDSLNLKAATGNGTDPDPGPIVFLPNEKVDIRNFKEKLLLKIAEINSEPSPIFKQPVKYGRGERSAPNVKWGPIGDYSLESLKTLILKTINRFSNLNIELEKDKLNWQHNAISHTLRMGLIKKNKNNTYKLTEAGKLIRKDNNKYINLLTEQLFKYSIPLGNNQLFQPYRALIKIIQKNKTICFEEFAFCLYPLTGSTRELVEQADERIKYFRNLNYKLSSANENNKDFILNKLNTVFETNFRKQDIWHTTTVRNKFIYFRNHLVNCNICKSENKLLKINNKLKVDKKMNENEFIESLNDFDEYFNFFQKTL